LQSDSDIAAGCATGDESAWRELVRREINGVFATAIRVLDDRDEAADVAQETFVKFRGRAAEFRDGGRLAPYLRRIAFRLAVRRKAARARLVSLEQHEIGGGDAAPLPLPDPSMAPQRQEQRKAIRAALESLPPGQRNALALRHVEGFSYVDIAEALDVPLGTVKTLLHRGRAALAATLAATAEV
jgi:RNA polymerase sigma-70 factor (ECF subfamily)